MDLSSLSRLNRAPKSRPELSVLKSSAESPLARLGKHNTGDLTALSQTSPMMGASTRAPNLAFVASRNERSPFIDRENVFQQVQESPATRQPRSEEIHENWHAIDGPSPQGANLMTVPGTQFSSRASPPSRPPQQLKPKKARGSRTDSNRKALTEMRNGLRLLSDQRTLAPSATQPDTPRRPSSTRSNQFVNDTLELSLSQPGSDDEDQQVDPPTRSLRNFDEYSWSPDEESEDEWEDEEEDESPKDQQNVEEVKSSQPTQSMFMHYTISEDRSGDNDSVARTLLAALRARYEERSLPGISRREHTDDLESLVQHPSPPKPLRRRRALRYNVLHTGETGRSEPWKIIFPVAEARFYIVEKHSEEPFTWPGDAVYRCYTVANEVHIIQNEPYSPLGLLAQTSSIAEQIVIEINQIREKARRFTHLYKAFDDIDALY